MGTNSWRNSFRAYGFKLYKKVFKLKIDVTREHAISEDI